MRKTHQLYHTLQESRLECAVLRSEAHRLRKDNSELKTALDAVQRELALLKAQITANSDRRLMENVDITSSLAQSLCMDSRQYESLCLQRVEKGWPGDPPPPSPFTRGVKL